MADATEEAGLPSLMPNARPASPTALFDRVDRTAVVSYGTAANGDKADCPSTHRNATDGNPSFGNVSDGDNAMGVASNLAFVRIRTDRNVHYRQPTKCLDQAISNSPLDLLFHHLSSSCPTVCR
jgi:hypothetical protein